MKKLLVVFALLGFVSAVLLAGCSKEEPPQPPAPETTNAPAQ